MRHQQSQGVTLSVEAVPILPPAAKGLLELFLLH